MWSFVSLFDSKSEYSFRPESPGEEISFVSLLEEREWLGVEFGVLAPEGEPLSPGSLMRVGTSDDPREFSCAK